MAKSAKAKNDEKKKERLVPITIRFTNGAIEAIGDVARRHNMTKAEIANILHGNVKMTLILQKE